MTLEELLRDESLRQREFPVAAKKIFLAHAGTSPLSRRVAEAMQEYLAATTHDSQEDCLPRGFVLETRQLAAQLLGCAPQEIALLGPTALGLSLVANGLDSPAGSNIVCYGDDYPTNVYPWRSRGGEAVEVRTVRPARPGEITLESVAEAVDERTRLVALASAHFLTGFRLDIAAIGKFLHERGILFCVDGIQTLGALRTTVEHVDFFAADSHKWLLGPNASGVFFVRREHFDRLRPTLLGAANVISPGFIAQDTMEFARHAGRYEPGALNLTGIVGLHACLKLIAELGIETIERRVLALAGWLVSRLQAKGYEIVGPTSGQAMTGIVSCHKPGANMEAVHALLSEHGVAASLRATRQGQKLLRFSPHFYNTEAELERVVALLS
ncbi:MAG: aminotransferase class V-fold PLP-dependent enzyme [Verrucomicrobia bacterium]|nr:aminotransferase class V-fold PLP-dependent enzyme [Verrucomicrobiota bacterium]